MRELDPVKLGSHEAAGWVAYHRRRWGAALRTAVAP